MKSDILPFLALKQSCHGCYPHILSKNLLTYDPCPANDSPQSDDGRTNRKSKIQKEFFLSLKNFLYSKSVKCKLKSDLDLYSMVTKTSMNK